MKISLHNTLLRRKQEFVPIDENNVRMYVCGPTVYDRAHLGNAKTSVVFDVLYRFLCQVYGKDHVTYVSNITDVDDKILNKHKETGKSIREITEQTFQWYLDDMKKLNVLNPNHRPRATEYIQEMIELVKLLLQNGHAYEAEGHVLFSVDSMPDYGFLSGRSMKEMLAGARIEVADLYRREYTSEQSFRKSVEQYVAFYNTSRPHQTLNYQTPQAFEAACMESL